MKSPQRMSDAGSIPATSTTTGVSGFDGMPSVGGQSAMVPAASGSAKSRRPVRWAKPELPTTTAITSRCFALRDVPHGRGVTKAVRVVPAIRGASFNAVAMLGVAPQADVAGSKSSSGANFNGANAGADRSGEAERVRFTPSGGPVTVGACRSVDGGLNPHARMPEISAGRSIQHSRGEVKCQRFNPAIS